MNKLHRKIILILTFILLGQLNLIAQKPDNTEAKPKEKKQGFSTPFVFIGLNIGASAYVDINLISGIQINERINAGLSGKYQYYSIGGAPDKGFNTHIYGGGVFLQVALIKDFRKYIKKIKTHNGIFVHAEYELLSLNESYFSSGLENSDKRIWLENILIGPGYINRFNRSSIFAMLLWNANKTSINPYDYPLFRVGFTYGF